MSVWAQYTIEHADRDGLAAHLKEQGVPTAVYYPVPLHLQPAYAHFPRGAGGLPAGRFIHESPDLNLYIYPEEVDYRRERPLDATWHRIDTCVREERGDRLVHRRAPESHGHRDAPAHSPRSRPASRWFFP